jgi:hypothetical protein
MSKLDLARKLIFLIGALVSIVMAAVSSWAAADPFDVDAYRWAPLWVGIPIICFYVVAELLVHWLPSTPIRIGLLLVALTAVGVPLLHAVIAVRIPLEGRGQGVWHLWPVFAIGDQLILGGGLVLVTLVVAIGVATVNAVRSHRRATGMTSSPQSKRGECS